MHAQHIDVDDWLVGTRALASRPLRVALVGTRSPSPEAEHWTRRTAYRLAEAGAVVVSGGARGVDAAAHEGALDARGVTWCVLPGAPGLRYPAPHGELFRRIESSTGSLLWAKRGAPHLVPGSFHQRNEQIARLCTHVILVRGGPSSGALSAVRHALKIGRKVYALAAAPWEPGAEACQLARRLGATELQGGEDLETLFGLLPDTQAPQTHAAPSPQLGLKLGAGPSPGSSDPVQSALADGSLSLEELLDRTGFSLAELGMRLLTLEGECVVKDPLSGHYRLVKAPKCP